MKKKILIEKTSLLAGLALGLALPASAQSAAASSAAPSGPVAASGYGLLGENYSQLDFGYQKEFVDTPQILHDYGYTYNQPIIQDGLFRTDIQFGYDYLTGSALGAHDYINEALGGFTEYLAQGWGSPFVTAEAGGAWQHADNVARKSGAYAFTAGVALPLFKELGAQSPELQELVLTPYVEYQTEPYLYNHERPFAFYPDHDWTYGLKATYPVLRHVNLTVGINWDQYNRNDFGSTAGLSFSF